MKNLITLALLFVAFLMSAQEAVKYPLLEHFTNTRCPICASRNPGFHDLRKSYGDAVHHIAYHPKYPYQTCEFYQANMEGNMVRTNYFGIAGTPTVYLDGVEGSGTNLINSAAIDAAIESKSFFEIDVSEVVVGNLTEVTVNVTSRGEVPENTSYRLFVALAEAVVDYNAPNGEHPHYNVFRKFISPREGELISPPDNNMSTSFSYQYTVNSEWDEEEIYALAFIQNDDEQYIENSGTASSTTTSVRGDTKPTIVNIHPNPTESKLFLSEPVQRWSLYDLNGRLVEDKKLNTASKTINLEPHQKGVYFIRLELGEGKAEVKKILLQ